MTGSVTLGVNQTANKTFGGTIQDGQGTLALSKSGAAVLVLSGPNSYSGGTTISGGTLQLGTGINGQDGSLSNSGGILDNAVLVYNLYGSQTYSGAISGNGSLTKTGSTSVLTLAGSNNYTGATGISNGVLHLANSAALAGGGSLTFSGGTLQFAAANTSLSNLVVSDTAAAVFDTNGQSATFAGSMDSSNSKGLTKIGAGTLTLAGSLSYVGRTTVSAGTLTLTGSRTETGAGPTNTESLLVSGPGAVLNVRGAYNRIGAVSNTLMSVQNDGLVNVYGSLSWGSSGGSQNGIRIGETSAGTLNIDGGAMTINLASGNTTNIGFSAGAGVVNVANGTLAVTGVSGMNVGASGAGSGTVNIYNGGVLVFAGSGSLQLASTTSSSGAVYLYSGGLLQTNHPIIQGAGSGTFYFDGGTLQATASSTIFLQGLTAAYVQQAGAIIDDGGNTITIGQNLLQGTDAGTGGLTKTGSGTLILSGADNTYTGVTAVESGTLIVNNPGALFAGTSLTVGNSSAFALATDRWATGSSREAASGEATLGATLAAVPEPGALALLAAALWSAAIYRRFRRRSKSRAK